MRSKSKSVRTGGTTSPKVPGGLSPRVAPPKIKGSDKPPGPVPKLNTKV